MVGNCVGAGMIGPAVAVVVVVGGGGGTELEQQLQ